MEHEQNPQPLTSPGLGVLRSRAVPLIVAVVAGLGVGYLLMRVGPTEVQASNLPPPMRDWPKPDLVLVVSGQMHGYIGPCGCSHPQKGGLVRRYNLIDLLKGKGWPVVGLDLGELPQTKGLNKQALLKYELSMKALDLMGYRAVGIGKTELEMPLTELLANYSLNHPNPRPLAVNLADAVDPKQIYHQLNARPWEIIADFKPRLGVLSVIGYDLKDSLGKTEKFLPTGVALHDALQDFAAGQVELGVVMYHEHPDKKKMPAGANETKWIEEQRLKQATACVKFCEEERTKNPRVPPIALVMSLTDEPEPPGQLGEIKGTNAKLLDIGHKGRFVGVVGIFRKGAEFEIKYQLVSMDPEYEEPAGPNTKNPVVELMEQYTRQVAKENLLARVPRTPHHTQIDSALLKKGINARFIGSERCGDCHEHAYNVWSKSRHAHAFKTLVERGEYANRQFDPECVVCHTVGFKNPTGYYDPPDKAQLAKHNAKLENVGCENCHGPGSAHADNPNDVSLYPLINPFRASEKERKAARDAANPALPPAQQQDALATKNRLERTRMQQLDFNFCQKCHDLDNDVNWSRVSFADKWMGGRIIHMTPRPGNQAVQPEVKQRVPALPTGQQK